MIELSLGREGGGRVSLSFLVRFILCFGLSVEAQAADFVKPRPLVRAQPVYPESRAEKAHDGIVKVSMMVSPSGVVYAPVARMSTHPEFEKSAMKAVLKYTFEPATLNGVPIDSHFQIDVVYAIDGAKDAVSRQFSKAYSSAKKELAKDKPSQNKLDSKIRKLRSSYYLTHYSLAHLATLELSYAAKFGSDSSQLAAFEKLFLFDRRIGGTEKLLNNDLLLWAKQSVLALRLRLGQLDVAYKEYLTLRETDSASVSAFKESMVTVRDILVMGKPFEQKIALGKRGYREVYLVATKFGLEATSGEIEKLTFRCQKGFSEVDYQADSEYEVPEKWGQCWMQVTGAKQTTASLIQYK